MVFCPGDTQKVEFLSYMRAQFWVHRLPFILFFIGAGPENNPTISGWDFLFHDRLFPAFFDMCHSHWFKKILHFHLALNLPNKWWTFSHVLTDLLLVFHREVKLKFQLVIYQLSEMLLLPSNPFFFCSCCIGSTDPIPHLSNMSDPLYGHAHAIYLACNTFPRTIHKIHCLFFRCLCVCYALREVLVNHQRSFSYSASSSVFSFLHKLSSWKQS